jgi:hypothetical protein
MTIIPAQRFTVIAKLAAILLATASCAVELSPPSALPLPALELNAATAIEPGEPLERRPNLGSIDLWFWHNRTNPPESELDVQVGDFVCSLIYPLAVPPGQWVLVGVSEEQHYTPILDIYSDQTGISTKNDTVYYHFQLVESE